MVGKMCWSLMSSRIHIIFKKIRKTSESFEVVQADRIEKSERMNVS